MLSVGTLKESIFADIVKSREEEDSKSSNTTNMVAALAHGGKNLNSSNRGRIFKTAKNIRN